MGRISHNQHTEWIILVEYVISSSIDFVANHDQCLCSAAWMTPAQCSSCLRHGYLFQLTDAQGKRAKKEKGNITVSEKRGVRK